MQWLSKRPEHASISTTPCMGVAYSQVGQSPHRLRGTVSGTNVPHHSRRVLQMAIRSRYAIYHHSANHTHTSVSVRNRRFV